MKNRSTSLGLAITLFVAIGAPAWALPDSVAALMRTHGLSESALSVVIRRVGEKKSAISHNPSVMRNPASTMKVVTTAAALQLLGPQFQWRTDALTNGRVVGNTLEGDLILRGSGDPWLVIERFWLLAKKLRDAGIAHIRGDLVIDDTRFDRKAIGSQAIDGKSMRTYNTPPSALLVNFGATVITIDSNPGGFQVYADPAATTLNIKNNVTLNSDDCTTKGRRITLDLDVAAKSSELRVGGFYPKNCGPTTFSRTLLPHDQYVYGVFKALWQQLGGTFEGTWRYGKTPTKASVLAELESATLTEVIRYINKFSNNVMARNLLLSLASESGTVPATPEKAEQVIKIWLEKNAIAMPGLKIDNGAGLSREARLSAEGLAALLEAAVRLPWWPEFLGSLPIAEVDGSLKKRFHNLAEPGRLRLKTGLLKDVRALAGYVIDRKGDIWVVVILHNDPRAAQPIGIEIQHHLLETIFEDRPVSG